MGQAAILLTKASGQEPWLVCVGTGTRVPLMGTEASNSFCTRAPQMGLSATRKVSFSH